MLAASLIVRDEAEHLDRCLASVADLVDEIVVVDTGSVDASVAVARSYGAVVLHRPWDGDFSAARNLGLDAVTADWVLYIDADEHVRPAHRELIHANLDDSHDHVAFRVLLQARRSFTPYREYRVWRNRPDIRFTGVIHESITPDISRIADAEGLRIGSIDLYLEHEGYEGDLTHKHLRNLPLLLRQVEADPDRVYLWGEIGRCHHGLGRVDEAIRAWQAGADRLRRRGRPLAVDSLVFVDLIATLAQAGRPDHALVAEADELFPDNLLVLWAGAIDAEARGDHAEVARRLDLVLDPARIAAAEETVSFDRRIVGQWGHHSRGMARFNMGDFAGAADDFAVAEGLEPGNHEYAVKRKLASAKARP